MGAEWKMLAHTLVLLDSVGELVDGGGHLQSLHQNSLLSLDSDVLWPLDETGEVSLWLDVTSESEVPGPLLEERALSRTTGGSAALRLDNFLSLKSLLLFTLHSIARTRPVSKD